MTLRIGKIPYLNSVLFYHALENDAAVRMVPLVPRALSSAAREDGVDAGPVPLVTCWELADRFEPLITTGGAGDFCISARGKAHSIFLYSKRPFDALDGATIGVTAETSTSVRLLKTLFAHCWRVRPSEYTRVNWPANDAFLLIGDEALIHRRGIKDYPHVADLGQVWNEWTGLPFVFARWAVRKDLPEEVRRSLVERIEASIASGWSRLDEIVKPWNTSLQMTTAEIRVYLEALRFHMNEQDREAIDRFRQLDAAIDTVDV